MIKSKKQSLIVIGAFLLILTLFTTTYAFFNYTRTGVANTIRVGRISFESKNEETISLTNLFPIDPSNTTDMNDNTKVGTYSIDITGDTDYANGIEYLVSAVDANIYTNQGQGVPISLDVTVTDLGTSDINYFTSRDTTNASIYKKLVGDTLVGDQMLLVGFIAPNDPIGTADGIEGSITIKAYLDKNKILISDTYDGIESDNMGTSNSIANGKTVLTTNEWNALQSSGVSFKVKVEANEGIWVTGSLEEIMKTRNYSTTLNRGIRDDENSDYVDNTTPGIDFGAISSDTNGKGVYMRAGTQNDAYPILYYRGEIEDNNVVFANKCWKAVRTTDTGGVKLIYNGELSANMTLLSENDYGTLISNSGFTFDATDNSWNIIMTTNVPSSNPLEISFNVPAGDGYLLQITGNAPLSGTVVGGVFKGGTQVNGFGANTGNQISIIHNFGTLTSNSSDVVKINYYTPGNTITSENTATLKIKMSHPDVSAGMGCNSNGTASQITIENTNTFRFSEDELGNGLYKSSAYVGYMRGTNVYEYKIKNSNSTFKFGTGFTYNNGTYTLTNAGDVMTDTKHYTCFTDSEICDGDDVGKIYYIYGKNGSDFRYIELENGQSVEDAIAEMQMNIVDSNAKKNIDKWYLANMTSYTNKLEDTIWCNDRSVNTQTSGWVSNGGNINENLYYAPYDRAFITYNPSLICLNKNDRFTVNNSDGNRALTYPVAMLTSDEIMLAGAKTNNTSNGSFYLNSGVSYWAMSPSSYKMTTASAFRIYTNGYLSDGYDVADRYGLRPVISIKPGQLINKGTGIVTDPYVIE